MKINKNNTTKAVPKNPKKKLKIRLPVAALVKISGGNAWMGH